MVSSSFTQLRLPSEGLNFGKLTLSEEDTSGFTTTVYFNSCGGAPAEHEHCALNLFGRRRMPYSSAMAIALSRFRFIGIDLLRNQITDQLQKYTLTTPDTKCYYYQKRGIYTPFPSTVFYAASGAGVRAGI
jgi:hypothetical protein